MCKFLWYLRSSQICENSILHTVHNCGMLLLIVCVSSCDIDVTTHCEKLKTLSQMVHNYDMLLPLVLSLMNSNYCHEKFWVMRFVFVKQMRKSCPFRRRGEGYVTVPFEFAVQIKSKITKPIHIRF